MSAARPGMSPRTPAATVPADPPRIRTQPVRRGPRVIGSVSSLSDSVVVGGAVHRRQLPDPWIGVLPAPARQGRCRPGCGARLRQHVAVAAR